MKWSRIVTADDLIQKMRFLESGYTLRIQDMDAIVEGLGLKEYSFEEESALVPASRRMKRPLVSRTTLIVLLIIFGVFTVGVFIVVTFPGAKVAAANALQGVITLVGGWAHLVTMETVKKNSTPEDSQQAIIYLNRFRVAEGMLPIAYDRRAYSLALARSEDMADFRYLNYTNPQTGSSALALKRWHGFSENETLLETLYGQWTGYTPGIERQAIDAWLIDPGNRQRLFFAQVAGAIACTDGYCSYIGVRPAPLIANETLNATGSPG